MMEEKLTQYMINDLVSAQEYSYEGIALYANSHPDALLEILANRVVPTAPLHRRILELHISARRDLYQGIMERVRNG